MQVEGGQDKEVTNADLIKAMARGMGRMGGGGGGGGSSARGLGSLSPSSHMDSHVHAYDAMKDSADKAARELDTFSSGLRKAVRDIAKVAGLMEAGNESGMSEVQLAARTGLDVRNVRRTRESLVENGLSESGATRTIAAAGSMQAKFGDAVTTATEYTRILSAFGTTDLDGLKGIDLPSIQELQAMNPQELIQMTEDMLQGKTMEERAAIGRIMDMPELSVSSGQSDVMGMDGVINKEGLMSHQRGAQIIHQAKRDAMEGMGSVLGEFGGIAAAGTVAAAGIAGFALSPRALGRAGGMKVPKGIGKLARLSPLGLIPLAGRAITGTGDDGTISDSLFDVAEFAGMGAMAGGMIAGPAGAVAGAVVGTGIGALNEFNEYLGGRSQMEPSTDIGKVADPTKSGSRIDVVNNTEINVTVDKELITVETNINGDLDTDEEATFNTAG